MTYFEQELRAVLLKYGFVASEINILFSQFGNDVIEIIIENEDKKQNNKIERLI